MNPAQQTRAPAASVARALSEARRRLMARRALESFAAALPWGLGLAAILVATQRLLGSRSPFQPDAAAVLAVAAGTALLPCLVGALSGALAGRLPDLSLALLVDRGHGLAERLTAAVALRADEGADAWAERALAALGTRDPKAALPLRPLPWRAAATALLALSVSFFLPAWPSPQAPPSTPDPKVVTAAAQLAKETAAAEKKLDESAATDEARRVLEEIRKAAERASVEPVTQQEAVQELQRLDQKVRREQERRDAADAGALQRALSSLEQAALQRDRSREAADGEAQDLEQQMKALAQRFGEAAPFEAREQKRIAARLRDAADALRATNPALSDKLEQLADAVEKGDMKAAQQLAQELAASAELQQMSAEAATDEALADARRMVQQAMASLGQAPTDEQLEQLRKKMQGGEGEGAGDGEGEGEGGKPGQGGKDRSGKARVAQDWGVGTTSEEAPEFRVKDGGQQADRQSSETSDWREAYEQLHDSTRLQDAKGRATRVQGQLGEGDMVTVQGRQQAQGPEAAALPRVHVPADYARANEEALAREEIPAAYEDSVRKYFTSLDAPSGTREAPPAAPPTDQEKKK